jgi:hypothetical protein
MDQQNNPPGPPPPQAQPAADPMAELAAAMVTLANVSTIQLV